tara:strand:+ start:1007 stop:1279 length:273 start_codon:yes stop_codon:yes gene_type:complete
MSKFIDRLSDYTKVEIVPKTTSMHYIRQYDNANDERKAIFDKYSDIILDKEIETRELNNLRSIKKNMQFLAWVMIFNLLGILYFIITLNV